MTIHIQSDQQGGGVSDVPLTPAFFALMHGNTGELAEVHEAITRAFDFGHSTVVFSWHQHGFQLRRVGDTAYRFRNLGSKRDLQRVILEVLCSPDKKTAFQAFTGETFELRWVGEGQIKET